MVLFLDHVDFVVVLFEAGREQFKVVDDLAAFDDGVPHAHAFDVERGLLFVVMPHSINIIFMRLLLIIIMRTITSTLRFALSQQKMKNPYLTLGLP